MTATYHQLGWVARDRGRLDDAEDWYLKSLAISEELGDKPGMARTYLQLGIWAQDRGRLDDAEDWYRKSLAISEELGDGTGMAISYHQLGISAQNRGRLETRKTGTASRWPSRGSSATGPAWRHLLPARRGRPAPGAAG